MRYHYKDTKIVIEPIDALESIIPDNYDAVIGDAHAKFIQRSVIRQHYADGSTKAFLICVGNCYSPFNCSDTFLTRSLQKNQFIYFCSGEFVCKWNITLTALEWHLQKDDVSCFSIAFMDNETSILVSGELELTKIDLDGNTLWQYSGSDILVSQNGDYGAKILTNSIEITDRKNILHKLDFDGNIISAQLHDHSPQP